MVSSSSGSGALSMGWDSGAWTSRSNTLTFDKNWQLRGRVIYHLWILTLRMPMCPVVLVHIMAMSSVIMIMIVIVLVLSVMGLLSAYIKVT